MDLHMNFGPFNPVSDAEDHLNDISMKDNQHIIRYVVAFNRLAGRVSYDDAALHHCFYHGLPGHIKTRVTDLGKPDNLMAVCTMAQAINTHHLECKAEISCEQNHTNRDSHINNNLGLFYSGSNHQVKDCLCSVATKAHTVTTTTSALATMTTTTITPVEKFCIIPACHCKASYHHMFMGSCSVSASCLLLSLIIPFCYTSDFILIPVFISAVVFSTSVNKRCHLHHLLSFPVFQAA